MFEKSSTIDGTPLRIPFQRERGLFRLHAGIRRGSSGSSLKAKQLAPPITPAAKGRVTGKLKPGVRMGATTSHLEKLPADDLAAVLHRRLHLGADILRRLPERTSDVPQHLAASRGVACEHCAAANSTKVPHSSSRYQPTHAGRLVHADIAGPFVCSSSGAYKYLLLLTDDHTRFKFAYYLRRKSEAPA